MSSLSSSVKGEERGRTDQVAGTMGGYGFYFLSIITSYYVVKILIDKITDGRKTVTRPYKFEYTLYDVLFGIGIICLAITVYIILRNTDFLRDFSVTTNRPKDPYIGFGGIMLAFFGVFFVTEFIQFKRKRTSLIKNILHGYWTPLLAIIISSIFLSLYMELQNFPIKLWLYSGYYLGGVKLFNIPLWVWLTWPLHYIAVINLYRAFEDKVSPELLAGDKIR